MEFSRHGSGVEWVLLALVLVPLAAASAALGWLARADQAAYDMALQLWRRPPADDVVIIAVDDDSIAAIGRWPWRRAVHATLLNRLTEAQAKAVGLDIILTEADAAAPRSDAALAEAIRRNGKVVLPVVQMTWGRGWLEERAPLPMFAEGAAALGHAHVELDSDGIARTVFMHEGIGRARHTHFALALLRVSDPHRSWYPRSAGDDTGPGRADVWIKEGPIAVFFAGGPGHVPQYAYADVLRGDVPLSTFRDKIVLIGATGVGLGDDYPTPVSAKSRAMSGVEINANVVDTLRHGVILATLTPAQAAAVSGALALATLLTLRRVSARAGLLLTLVVCPATAAATVLLMRYGALWFPPASAVLACALAYPLWSWRRVEAAQRYLGEELRRLNSEPGLLDRSLGDPADSGSDPLQQRIAAVRAAADRSRDTRRFIIDTLDSLPVGVLVTGPTRQVILANHRALTLLCGANGLPLVGRPLSELFEALQWSGDDAAETLLQAAQRSIAPPQSEVRSASGSALLVAAAPAHDARGAVIGYIVSLDDISELRAVQHSRDEAMRFLSHDLRAPLSSIITLTESAASDSSPDATVSILQRVARQARRSLDLADDLLRLARAEAANPKRFATVDLRQVLEQALDAVWPLAQERRLGPELRAEVAEGEALVSGDAELLRRAVQNLLTNAIAHSPHGAPVVVSLEREGGQWQIAVADRGSGIAPEDLPALFTRYARLAGGAGNGERGTGLGLVIVKTVAERHGGAVDVASTPGEGSRFTIRLPQTPPAPPA
jgi:hypothetical protein